MFSVLVCRLRVLSWVRVSGIVMRLRLFLLLLTFFYAFPSSTHIYPLSLHDALPISGYGSQQSGFRSQNGRRISVEQAADFLDRKSTRLNSSHVAISYAVFCLKKKKKVSDVCGPVLS